MEGFAAALRARLWSGPLPDPAAPAQDLAQAIAGGLDYPPALAGLRALAAHALPLDPALTGALDRWRWSIDLAALATEARGEAAIPELAARVAAQGRRHGALAQAWWDLGRVDRAHAVLEDLDPASPSHLDDRVLRAELLMRASGWELAAADLAALGVTGDGPPLLSQGRAARLRLDYIWLREGAVALAASLDRDPPSDTVEAWDFLFHTWLTERDYPRACAALDRLARLRGGDALHLDTARLALDRDRPDAARAALAALPPRPFPERSPRETLLRLRLALMDADAAPDPAPLWQAARDQALAASRLWPRHGAIRHLTLTLRACCEDWDQLAAELAALAPEAQALQALARLGWPLPGRTGGPAALPRQIEDARTDAWLCLDAGDLGGAHAATDRDYLSRPGAAWFHEPYIEALLWDRRAEDARAFLDQLLGRAPRRLGLILQRARARFFLGDFNGADGDLATFRTLKAEAIGAPPPPDLRDLIVADARASGGVIAPYEPAAAIRDRLGAALEAHPGLAACYLARPGALPAFRPVPGAIAARPALYWEGELAGPSARGVARWAQVLDGPAALFTRDAARGWLAAHDPEALPGFDAQTGPAGRADVFRACKVAYDGGLFVDADEYPRESPAPWLDGAGVVVVLESGYGTAANNFLAARPGHPLMARFRAAVLARAQTPDPYPWWDTGPTRLTLALMGHLLHDDTAGLRILTQAQYCARITTNLPFPHKRTAGHWRQGLPSAARGTTALRQPPPGPAP